MLFSFSKSVVEVKYNYWVWILGITRVVRLRQGTHKSFLFTKGSQAVKTILLQLPITHHSNSYGTTSSYSKDIIILLKLPAPTFHGRWLGQDHVRIDYPQFGALDSAHGPSLSHSIFPFMSFSLLLFLFAHCISNKLEAYLINSKSSSEEGDKGENDQKSNTKNNCRG